MLLCKQNKYNYFNILMSYENEDVVWKFRPKMNQNDTLTSNSMLLNMNGSTLSENLVSKEGQHSFTVLKEFIVFLIFP